MRNKSTIAKLLSEEDINVVQKQATTASFDVKNRELVLPIWKDDMSDNIADLLVCHEIGHALYTSENMLNKMIERKIEKTFVNVIEDARIEKMVQQKYAGSRTVFLKGYKELIDKDFFGTKDKDISKMNLIDRINLYYKGTSDTPFAEQEKIWVEKVGNVKTEDDVLNLAEELYKWMQENKESQGEEPEQGQESQSSAGSETSQEQSQSSGSEESDSNDSGQTQSQGSNDEEGDEEQNGSTAQSEQDSEETEGTQEIITNGQEGGQSQGKEFTATTDTSYNNKFNEVRDIDAKDRNYSFIPKVKLDKTIISPKEIFEEMKLIMPSLDNISWGRLEKESYVTYPAKSETSLGEEIIFTDGFPTTNNLAKIVPVKLIGPNESINDDYPLILSTGRMLEHWHTGSMTRRTKVLDAVEPQANASLHPRTLRNIGVSPGEIIDIETRRGKISIMARADKSISEDMVFLPFAFVEAAANILTNPQIDPYGKIPEFKFSACKIQKTI